MLLALLIFAEQTTESIGWKLADYGVLGTACVTLGWFLVRMIARNEEGTKAQIEFLHGELRAERERCDREAREDRQLFRESIQTIVTQIEKLKDDFEEWSQGD